MRNVGAGRRVLSTRNEEDRLIRLVEKDRNGSNNLQRPPAGMKLPDPKTAAEALQMWKQLFRK